MDDRTGINLFFRLKIHFFKNAVLKNLKNCFEKTTTNKVFKNYIYPILIIIHYTDLNNVLGSFVKGGIRARYALHS